MISLKLQRLINSMDGADKATLVEVQEILKEQNRLLHNSTNLLERMTSKTIEQDLEIKRLRKLKGPRNVLS